MKCPLVSEFQAQFPANIQSQADIDARCALFQLANQLPGDTHHGCKVGLRHAKRLAALTDCPCKVGCVSNKGEHDNLKMSGIFDILCFLPGKSTNVRNI
ncbi:hypothetical protein TH30_18000 [Thalassospira profundimaris]|uniref:Uncharacterized protein n=1 Tax=Thalassospira profundimaris TaxID=502049 RepID=A0A367WSU0_9PROT|nr:hypothetical protein TH30_18000 [Thalassospira profundimaris]